jgi:hypothetical protein
MLNKITAFVLITMCPLFAVAQESIDREITDFDKLIVSPHINLVLTEGESPAIRVEYENIDVHEINVDQSGKTLKLYLENAKIVERTEEVMPNYRRGIYHDAVVTAYVTFTSLEMLEVRGDQEVRVNSPINAEQFRLKVYGENDIRIAAVNADYLKVTMFGENDLRIDDGAVDYQKYTLYGENAIEVSELISQHSHANIYGESEISLHAAHELKLTSMGEPIISYTGKPVLNKGLIVGEPRIFARE